MAQATSDTNFLSTVGINTGVTYISSAYQNYAQMINALSYIGVKQVRDTYDSAYAPAEFPQIANQLGIKYDFYIALGDATPEWQISQIKANAAIVSYVEGYNESDTWWQTFHGATGPAATQAVQQYIDDAVHSDPTLSGVGVIQATFASPASFPLYGDQSAHTDYASTHTYFGTGNNPSGSENVLIARGQSISPGRPTIATEAGFFTMPGNANGVSQVVQAKYDLDLLFEQANLGVKLTYLWELADNYPDPYNTNSEDHFGIFNADWTPKLAAIALHDTMQIMADPGTGGVTPAALDYTFDGLPNSVQTALYQKSDGTFVLVVWNDVRLSGPVIESDITVAPIATTLHLGQQFAHIAIFDPLTGTAATQTFANASAIGLQVVDHPLIIELSQDPAFQAPSSTIEAPSQIITTPLAAVQIDGLSFASTATVSSPSICTPTPTRSRSSTRAGHLIAVAANDFTLTGTVATVNAELATVNYTGGTALGNDVLTLSSLDPTGAAVQRSVAVTIAPGTPASVPGGPTFIAPLDFTSTAGIPILLARLSVADAYAATHPVTVSLSITANGGTLQVPATGGAALFGNATSSLLITGSFAQVAALLQNVSYTAALGTTQDKISYEFTDQTGFDSPSGTMSPSRQPPER